MLYQSAFAYKFMSKAIVAMIVQNRSSFYPAQVATLFIYWDVHAVNERPIPQAGGGVAILNYSPVAAAVPSMFKSS